MLIFLLIYLLISNALSLRKDQSILFSRIVMVSLILNSFLAINNLFVITLDKGIGIYGGLFHVTAFTQSFNIFIFVMPVFSLLIVWIYFLYDELKVEIKKLTFSLLVKVLLVRLALIYLLFLSQMNYLKILEVMFHNPYLLYACISIAFNLLIYLLVYSKYNLTKVKLILARGFLYNVIFLFSCLFAFITFITILPIYTSICTKLNLNLINCVDNEKSFPEDWINKLEIINVPPYINKGLITPDIWLTIKNISLKLNEDLINSGISNSDFLLNIKSKLSNDYLKKCTNMETILSWEVRDPYSRWQNNPSLKHFPTYIEIHGLKVKPETFTAIFESLAENCGKLDLDKIPLIKATFLDHFDSRYALEEITHLEAFISYKREMLFNWMWERELLTKASKFLDYPNTENRDAFLTWQKRQIALSRNLEQVSNAIKSKGIMYSVHMDLRNFSKDDVVFREIYENLLYINVEILKNISWLHYIENHHLTLYIINNKLTNKNLTYFTNILSISANIKLKLIHKQLKVLTDSMINHKDTSTYTTQSIYDRMRDIQETAYATEYFKLFNEKSFSSPDLNRFNIGFCIAWTYSKTPFFASNYSHSPYKNPDIYVMENGFRNTNKIIYIAQCVAKHVNSKNPI